MTNARSIHIGLNYVDPNAYGGWDGELAGCINDARDMQAIAESLGYTSTRLIDSEATSHRVISEIGQVADELAGGDILFLSYSGHGGQVDDVNGDEEDIYDETWCLWDRELVDDELYCLWSRFRPGVRIVVLSDSCHSGTAVRMLRTVEDLSRQMTRTRSGPSEEDLATIQALSRTLGLDSKALGGGANRRKPGAKGLARTRSSMAARAPLQPGSLGVPRAMPPDVQRLVNESHRSVYAAAQWMAGPSERARVAATVLLISGCQDNQLSLDGASNGLFTQTLKSVWNDGTYTGDYRQFWQDIRKLMPARQQPNFLVVGAANPAFEGQSPFEIGDGSVTPVTPFEDWNDQPAEPTDEPTGAERPILRQGASGEAVKDLQKMLRDLQYYRGAIDGRFGPGTASSVRSFQNAYGLTADGEVGPLTWDMLDTAIQELEPA